MTSKKPIRDVDGEKDLGYTRKTLEKFEAFQQRGGNLTRSMWKDTPGVGEGRMKIVDKIAKFDDEAVKHTQTLNLPQNKRHKTSDEVDLKIQAIKKWYTENQQKEFEVTGYTMDIIHQVFETTDTNIEQAFIYYNAVASEGSETNDYFKLKLVLSFSDEVGYSVICQDVVQLSPKQIKKIKSSSVQNTVPVPVPVASPKENAQTKQLANHFDIFGGCWLPNEDAQKSFRPGRKDKPRFVFFKGVRWWDIETDEPGKKLGNSVYMQMFLGQQPQPGRRRSMHMERALRLSGVLEMSQTLCKDEEALQNVMFNAIVESFLKQDFSKASVEQRFKQGAKFDLVYDTFCDPLAKKIDGVFCFKSCDTCRFYNESELRYVSEIKALDGSNNENKQTFMPQFCMRKLSRSIRKGSHKERDTNHVWMVENSYAEYCSLNDYDDILVDPLLRQSFPKPETRTCTAVGFDQDVPDICRYVSVPMGTDLRFERLCELHYSRLQDGTCMYMTACGRAKEFFGTKAYDSLDGVRVSTEPQTSVKIKEKYLFSGPFQNNYHEYENSECKILENYLFGQHIHHEWKWQHPGLLLGQRAVPKRFRHLNRYNAHPDANVNSNWLVDLYKEPVFDRFDFLDMLDTTFCKARLEGFQLLWQDPVKHSYEFPELKFLCSDMLGIQEHFSAAFLLQYHLFEEFERLRQGAGAKTFAEPCHLHFKPFGPDSWPEISMHNFKGRQNQREIKSKITKGTCCYREGVFQTAASASVETMFLRACDLINSNHEILAEINSGGAKKSIQELMSIDDVSDGEKFVVAGLYACEVDDEVHMDKQGFVHGEMSTLLKDQLRERIDKHIKRCDDKLYPCQDVQFYYQMPNWHPEIQGPKPDFWLGYESEMRDWYTYCTPECQEPMSTLFPQKRFARIFVVRDVKDAQMRTASH